MMPAIWLHAYKRPDFIEDCATTDQITAIQRNYFRQIGIWMISLIRDGRFLRSPRSVIDV